MAQQTERPGLMIDAGVRNVVELNDACRDELFSTAAQLAADRMLVQSLSLQTPATMGCVSAQEYTETQLALRPS